MHAVIGPAVARGLLYLKGETRDPKAPLYCVAPVLVDFDFDEDTDQQNMRFALDVVQSVALILMRRRF